MIASVFSAFTIYYFIYWSYRPPPSPLKTDVVSLGWPNQGPLFIRTSNVSKFYLIQIQLSYYNYSVTQYQEVTISSPYGGYVSSNLASELMEVHVNYQKTVPFDPRRVMEGHLTDVTFHVEKDNFFKDIDDLVSQSSSHVQWQTAGDDYPTVTLIFKNGTMLPHPYPEQTLNVQSLTAANERITNEIWHQQEIGLLIVFSLFTAIDGIVIAIYQHFGPKEE